MELNKIILALLIFFSLLLLSRTSLASSKEADLEIKAKVIRRLSNYRQYRIELKNNGPNPSKQVEVNMIEPEGSSSFVSHVIKGVPMGCGLNKTLCFDNMAPGDKILIDLVAHIRDDESLEESYTVKINSQTTDSVPSNNTFVFALH